MKKPTKDSIEKATQRVKNKLTLAKLRTIPKFRNISKEEYNRLITNAEKLALVIFQLYIANNVHN